VIRTALTVADLRLKCTKFDFGWGRAPPQIPPGELTAPLAGFGGRFVAWGRGWTGEEQGRRGRGVEEREGPKVTVEPGPHRALLRHCT